MPSPTEPTPRPWVAQSRDDGASDPWWIDTHAYPDGPEPVWAPPQYPVSKADVALICEAVNNYDRLKKIEAAARALLASGGFDTFDTKTDMALLDLRDALEREF